MDFGERLKFLRNKKKDTQDITAKNLGMPLSTYASYEINKRRPNFDELVKLAQYFNVTTDYLLGLDDKKAIEREGIKFYVDKASNKKEITDDELKAALELIESVKHKLDKKD